MSRFQRWLWRRRDRRWQKYLRRLGMAGRATTPVELFFDAPLRTALEQYWDGGHRDVTGIAIQARVAYLMARWTFWLTIITGGLVVTTVATLIYTVLRDSA